MQPIELVEQYMGDYKILGEEINVKHCPFCGPNTKSDNQYKFYVNKNTGAYNCKRANKCGATGSLYDLAKHYGVEDEMGNDYNVQQKRYKKPQIEVEEDDSLLKKYLKVRGFHAEIIDQLPVEQYNHSYLGKSIAFLYYENDSKNPTFIKYRNFKKKNEGRKYLREKNTKPILWNMNNINTDEPLLITEGEFDAMAAIQSGFKNAVSIPSGAEDFSWIDNCWDFLEEIDEFIIWGDNDPAGKKFQEQTAIKLGEERCKLVQHLSNYNDANEVMFKEGEEKVLNMILNAKEMPIESIIRLAEVNYKNDDKDDSVGSGFAKLDRALSGLGMGKISVWTGENGSGKSTILGQVLIESIEHNYNVCAFSGELPKKKFRHWIERQMASERFITSRKNQYDAIDYTVPDHIREKMANWYYDKFFLFDADKVRVDADKVLKRFEQTAKRYNTKVFLIDNLIKMNLDKNNHYAAQSEFIDKCSVFAHKYNAHVHIVAHPRKSNNALTKMDISGSGDITNLADNVFLVVNTSDNKEKYHDAEIGILKDRWNGNSGVKVNLLFNKPDLRFSEEENSVQFKRKYKWERDFNAD